MASKRVRLPSAKLANESGVEDSFNDVDERSEATFATERTSGLISDVFETDQGMETNLSNYTFVEMETQSISFPIQELFCRYLVS